jgi:hypothetical protein
MALELPNFSNDELRRLQASLKRRFREANVIDVAFGPGQVKGKQDPRRPFCACFFVSNKRNPRNKKERIPKTVKCRLKRMGKFVTFEIPTDVVRTRKMKMTGRRMRRLNTSKKITTGGVVSWKEQSSSKRKWAVVTVGHHFPKNTASGEKVKVFRTKSDYIVGHFMFQSKKSSKLDVAVARCSKSDLRHFGLIPANSIPKLKPRTVDQLKSDIGKSGKSLIPPKDSKITIDFDHFFPENDEVDALWTIRNVVRTESKKTGAFKGGRSGTVFATNSNQVSAMQYAGTTGNAKEGLGQSYDTIMDWVEKQLKAKSTNLVSGSLRLVSIF